MARMQQSSEGEARPLLSGLQNRQQRHALAYTGFAMAGSEMDNEDIVKLVNVQRARRSLASGLDAWTQDITAGLTVSLVNIPLSLSLAVAAQAHPAQGIITAVWAGLFASMFGGSAFNIVGPTGALSGILSKYADQLGAGVLPWLAITSAAVMLTAYILRWDRYAVYVPSSVNEGFTLGVAGIIAVGQLPAALGLAGMHAHSNVVGTMWEVVARYSEYNYASIALAFGLWFMLYGLIRHNPKVPWSILIVSMGVAIGFLDAQGHLGVSLTTLKDRYGMLEPVVIEPSLSRIAVPNWWSLVVATLSVAFVSVLETIISGKIADNMTHTTMDQRQEVMGLALANIASGLAGGLPATAALARTSLNIKSGAHTKVSGIASAILTGILAFLVMPLFSYMPVTVVSALLFQVSVGMVDTKHLMDSLHHDRTAFIMTLLVAAVSCAVDPTSGIVFGAILGLLGSADTLATGFCEISVTNDFQEYLTVGSQRIDQLAMESAKPSSSLMARLRNMFWVDRLVEVKTQQSAQTGWQAAIYRPVGSLSYLSALSHTSRIQALCPSKHLILSMRFVDHIDMDGVVAIHHVISEMEGRGVTVSISTLAPHIHQRLMLVPWFQSMESAGVVSRSLAEATEECKKNLHA